MFMTESDMILQKILENLKAALLEAANCVMEANGNNIFELLSKEFQ